MLNEIFNKKENKVMLWVVCLSIIFVFFGFYLLDKNDQSLEPRKIPNTIEDIEWVSFNDKKYSIDLEYPNHFNEFEYKKDNDVIYNFYFNLKKDEKPLYFDSNESHLSVYPKGSKNLTQGLAFKNSVYENNKSVKFNLFEYSNVKGVVWGVMAVPVETPENWDPKGFIWFSSRLIDQEIKCFNNSVEKDLNSCEPYNGDQIIKSGDVIDKDMIDIGFDFLDRINF